MIARTASGRYQIRVAVNGRRRKATFATRQQAQPALDEPLLERKRVELGLPSLMPRGRDLGGLIGDYLGAMTHLAVSAQVVYAAKLRPVLDWLDGRR